MKREGIRKKEEKRKKKKKPGEKGEEEEEKKNVVREGDMWENALSTNKHLLKGMNRVKEKEKRRKLRS